MSASYAYNPSGLRKAKTVGSSTKYFVYNGMNIVYEYSESVADGVAYFYGLNRTHNSKGEIYVYNAHGDVVQLVCDNAVVASYTYDAFGNLTSQIGESDNPFLYCGEYYDTETQTYYLRARYYNPANGRFTQQDAWAFMDTGDPLSLNLYAYCCNNPVMYVDPSGRFGIGFFLATGAVLGCSLLFSGCERKNDTPGSAPALPMTEKAPEPLSPIAEPSLTNEEKMFIAIIYAEAGGANHSDEVYEMTAQVFMNRKNYPQDVWRNVSSVSDVISQPGQFTAYSNERYNNALKYLSGQTNEQSGLKEAEIREIDRIKLITLPYYYGFKSLEGYQDVFFFRSCIGDTGLKDNDPNYERVHMQGLPENVLAFYRYAR